MIYTIHKITDNVVIGPVQDVDWIVVADIPRQMVKYNRVKPQNVCLINDDSVNKFNQEFEEF